MKRWALRICMFFLLGAIANVVVAWVCALSVNPHDVKPLRMAASDRADGIATLIVLDSRAFGSRVLRVISSAGTNLPQTRDAPPVRDVVPRWADRIGQSVDVINLRDGRGWPAISMCCAMQLPKKPSSNTFAVQTGWEVGIAPSILSGWQTIPRVLPLEPVWPGFGVNTVFYAMIVWVLIATPFELRRRLRIKRGFCPKCAYDLRGSDSPACPECGVTR